MSNETIALLSARRSVAARQMQAPAPSDEELNTLLTLAARVPDHGKLVPWRFIVFSGEARVKAGEIIAAAFAADNPEADEKRLAAERERLTGAPLVVAVVSRATPHPKIPEWEQVLSAGAVCMNLVVAANAMGFATSWITEWYAYDRRVLEAFGLAANERIAGFVHIGTASETPPDRPRPELSAIVTRFDEQGR
ncbi:nitroreductase [Chelatococcus daeguensis]|uniref:Putative NAD(P)H nitroreductase n=1 Tax=Chelatococcus daeguensis TaxID=444444 RepID=A0AAC9NYY5_9HYPH|nr:MULTISPECIES: nitroreductase [Chelatococcus]APF37897.1 nitroreductase [Chelatococcus daeguensis]KZE28393.1 NAD(P)H nitroreductase [Chelatococcus daeguensis]MBM3083341.1 nitroreductase [Chelatococcus daeguensis]